MKLDCCFDKPPTDSGSCSAYSKCTDQGLKGECCPAANGQYLNCCNEKPDFPIVGDSYCSCSYPLDFDCYQFGKPECCLKNSIDCPKEQPECEIRFPIVGDSYCEYSPDFGCYKYGRPECCRNDSIECPKERPECEIGLRIIVDSYCTYSPNYGCYKSGWPECYQSDSQSSVIPSWERKCIRNLAIDYCHRY